MSNSIPDHPESPLPQTPEAPAGSIDPLEIDIVHSQVRSDYAKVAQASDDGACCGEASSCCGVSDDIKIASLLSADGVSVARRTVAKYREAMTIPSSSERRKRQAV